MNLTIGESLEERMRKWEQIRLYHVHHTHPRLLYLFSDVLIIVHSHAQHASDLLNQLFKWAEMAAAGSAGLAVKPQLVLVFNKVDDTTFREHLDEEEATKDWFSTKDDALPRLQILPRPPRVVRAINGRRQKHT